MTTLRPQLGATLPSATSPIVDKDGVASLGFWRVIERLVAMNSNDEIFMQEVNQEFKNGEIDDLRAQIAVLVAATQEALDAASAAAAAAEDATALLVSTASDAEAQSPRGALAFIDEAARTDMVTGTLGASATSGTPVTTKWYTAGGTPTKAKADYDTITFESEDFVVLQGSRLEISWSYTQRGLLNMFETFAWQEIVEIQTPGGTTIVTLITDNQNFGCAVSNNSIPGGYDPALDFGPTHSNTTEIDIPALTGLWPSDGVVKVVCDLVPLGAYNGGNDCIIGGTFTASLIKSDYQVQNGRIKAELVNGGPTTIVI
ncbi:MAG: hypothetical protein JKY52_08575 [Flavobacteriales bacterium]|nr:hypothetical protein [Flavobacteriales bacterium]